MNGEHPMRGTPNPIPNPILCLGVIPLPARAPAQSAVLRQAQASRVGTFYVMLILVAMVKYVMVM